MIYWSHRSKAKELQVENLLRITHIYLLQVTKSVLICWVKCIFIQWWEKKKIEHLHDILEPAADNQITDAKWHGANLLSFMLEVFRKWCESRVQTWSSRHDGPSSCICGPVVQNVWPCTHQPTNNGVLYWLLT